MQAEGKGLLAPLPRAQPALLTGHRLGCMGVSSGHPWGLSLQGVLGLEGRPRAEGLQISWGKVLEQAGTDRWTPEHLSGRWCRREARGPASVGAALWCSVAVWDAASWAGKSHSPLQQVSVEHLLRARCCSRPLPEHVFL